MRPYMVFSRYVGPQEGAILVFANSAKEAKLVGWRAAKELIFDEWIEVGVHSVKENPYIKSLAKSETPHAIVSPPSCDCCGYWGKPLRNGLCDDCEALGDEIW